MKTSNRRNATIILWIARVWGSFILAFVLFFALGHLFGIAEGSIDFTDYREILSIIFFPISTIIGLSLAYKWEGLGASITLFGMIGLFCLRFDLITNPYFLVGILPPAIFYLLYWYLSRSPSSDVK